MSCFAVFDEPVNMHNVGYYDKAGIIYDTIFSESYFRCKLVITTIMIYLMVDGLFDWVICNKIIKYVTHPSVQ